MIFMIVGGLGIFLLGMKNMSEGMQAVAGDKLRRMINAITNNRLLACGVGAGVTCLIQSSSITTVMVVGMVNASLMTLTQAIGVILGANIGTTITGWILVLKVGKFGLPLIGVSAFFYLFAKRDRLRFTASVFLGLGMVFYGLQLMKLGFEPLGDMPEFQAWFAKFEPENYFGVIKCCLVGALLTAIVQSSSATLGITLGLAASGLIDFQTGAALVLGENIGTTITAYLASLGTNHNAKRAAYAHMLVNLIGVFVITLFFFPYMALIEKLLGGGMMVSSVEEGGKVVFAKSMQGIALTHTVFNVVNAFAFLPLIGLLAKLLYMIVPEVSETEISHLSFLDVRMLDTPALGIQQSQKEIIKMGESVGEMLPGLREVLERQKRNPKIEEALFESERRLDLVQKEIVEFLSNMMSGNISHYVMDVGRHQLRVADEFESISDYITVILKLNLKIHDTGQKMSAEGLADIIALHDSVANYIDMVNKAVVNDDGGILLKARSRGQEITHMMKECRTRHLERVGTTTTTPLKSLIYTDMLNAYRRIKDHALNVAEVLAGEK
ncbi:MAG: Na/Pi cotransporter family protein [Planctomycetes bacterium]|nr:Na/Pi cotransporter family protein [Planctomycetota bacterium]